MAKPTRRYVCQECGAIHPRWSGRCDACEAWNSVIEEVAEAAPPGSRGGSKGKSVPFVPLSGTLDWAPRNATGIGEFDRVLGGGLVPGSAVLIGGDPGIGKSTLLLQVVAKLAEKGGRFTHHTSIAPTGTISSMYTFLIVTVQPERDLLPVTWRRSDPHRTDAPQRYE